MFGCGWLHEVYDLGLGFISTINSDVNCGLIFEPVSCDNMIIYVLLLCYLLFNVIVVHLIFCMFLLWA